MQVSNVNVMQTLSHRTAIAYTVDLYGFCTLTQIIYSYHGSKYVQRSGYNYIGPIEPQISGTKHTKNLELTR